LEYQVKIAALEGNFVPAAAVPVAISELNDSRDLPPAALRWDSDLSAILRTDRDLLAEDRVLVQSVLPDFQTADLLTRRATAPPDAIHLSLPVGFPQSVTDLATEVIKAATGFSGQETFSIGADQPYLVARALQDWFRSEFTYSLDIPSGHGSSALERFLEDRIGYCEQFAAAFVAMARSQGLASRVAVGYTPGIQRRPGVYSVQGRHAHAWPEVWFDGLGWVPFEPTPGRGVPGSEDYTGLPAAQDGPIEALDPTSEEGAGFDALDEIPDLSDLSPGPVDNEGDPSSPDTAQDPTSWSRLQITLGAAVAFLTLIAGVGPWLWRNLRSRRLRRLTADQQIVALWSGQLAALRRNGIISAKSMTISEIQRAAEQRLPALATPVSGLATCAILAGFARDPQIDEAMLAQCHAWNAHIHQILARRKGPVSRATTYFAVWRDRANSAVLATRTLTATEPHADRQ
jgi:hypothetical protein